AVTGDGLITATAPPLGVGNYAVIVVNPDERIATLPNAFQVFPVDLVTPPVAGSSDSGCASTSPLSAVASLLLALALIARARARADCHRGSPAGRVMLCARPDAHLAPRRDRQRAALAARAHPRPARPRARQR